MVTMRPWIEAGPSAQQSRPAVPAQPAVAQPAAPRSTSMGIPAAPPVPPRTAAGAAAGPAAPSDVAAPTTMVGQIDAILQTRLAGTTLAGRGVRLIESLDGGVSVMVGLQRFAGVGEVPDGEVQAAIRAAIAEWEKRFTPGI